MTVLVSNLSGKSLGIHRDHKVAANTRRQVNFFFSLSVFLSKLEQIQKTKEVARFLSKLKWSFNRDFYNHKTLTKTH